MAVRETEQKKIRYEWRKMLEDGYDSQIEARQRQNALEVKNLRTGPTSINALGTHYSNQQKTMKIREDKIEKRASRVADVIKAPSIKDST